jgi:hypothetical protein
MTHHPIWSSERWIHSKFRERRAYFMAVGSLITFNLALFLFAAIPLAPEPNPFTPEEAVVTVVSFASAILVALHAAGKRGRFHEWTYLVPTFGIVLTMISFPTRAALDDDMANWSVMEILLVETFLWCGLFLSFALHMEYGGRRPLSQYPRRSPDDPE